MALSAAIGVYHPLWLKAAGGFLVQTDPPERADLVLVLGGDWLGYRILEAARLVENGYAPKVLVSSPHALFGRHEHEFSIPFAVGKGYPKEWFEAIRISATSTKEEARELIPELRRRGAGTVLVVTSNFHTRRARRIFRAEAAGNPEILVVAAQDKHFRPEDWWKNREAQKAVFLEWTKTLTSLLGI